MAGLLNPKSFVEGGIFDDFDGTIVGIKFDRTDYAGTRQDKVPALVVTYRNDDEEGSKPFTNHYGVGAAEDWAPSPDGETLLPLGGKAGLKDSCNTAIYTKHLEVVGVPEELLEAASVKISALIGLKAHWQNITREFNFKEGNKTSKVLVATRLIALPGEAAAEAPVANPLAALATARVAAYIAAAKKKAVNKADLVSLILNDAEVAGGDKNELIKLAIDDAFLTAGPWKYEGGTLKG